MGTITNTLENSWLNHIFKVTPNTPPTALFVALCTASISDTATGANLPEVANANSYQRTSVGTFATASSRSTTNESDIDFPQASGGDWGTVTYFAIVDSQTYGAGNAIAWGAFTTPKTVYSGNTAKILAGDLDIAVSASAMGTYLANKMLDHSLKNISYTVPTNLYVGLATASIADDGSTLPEPPEAAAYARKNHNSWQTSSAGTTNNFGAVTFDTATNSWGTITGEFISDASTYGGGNLLVWGTLDSSQAITTNDVLEFASGALQINLD